MSREEEFKEIERLLLEQVELDKKKLYVVGTGEAITRLLQGATDAGYGHLHPAWGIPLYLRRN